MHHIYLQTDRSGWFPKLTEEPLPEGTRGGITTTLIQLYPQHRWREACEFASELATLSDAAKTLLKPHSAPPLSSHWPQRPAPSAGS